MPEWEGWTIAFTGESRCTISGFRIDREMSIALAERVGLHVYPRVTKKVNLLVSCEPRTANEAKAREYGIRIVEEAEFWGRLGMEVEALDWRTGR